MEAHVAERGVHQDATRPRPNGSGPCVLCRHLVVDGLPRPLDAFQLAGEQVVIAVGRGDGASWLRARLNVSDGPPVELRGTFKEAEQTSTRLQLRMATPEILAAELEVRREGETGSSIVRSRLRRSADRPFAAQTAATEEIRCPVPVHYSLPFPEIPYLSGPVADQVPDSPEKRAFAAQAYERAKTDILDPRFPDDPDFKRAYLLMWQDWASRQAGAPAVAPRDREWFWRWSCTPGTVERLRAKYPTLFDGASP